MTGPSTRGGFFSLEYFTQKAKGKGPNDLPQGCFIPLLLNHIYQELYLKNIEKRNLPCTFSQVLVTTKQVEGR